MVTEKFGRCRGLHVSRQSSSRRPSTLLRTDKSVTSLLAMIAVTITFVAGTSPAKDSAPDTDIPLMIQTVPAKSGVEFALEGRTFSSDDHGLALITVPSPGTYTLSVVEPKDGPNIRTQFAHWSDGSSSAQRSITIRTFTYLEAGFDVSRRTHFAFSTPDGTAVDPGRIESIAVTSSDGTSRKLPGGSPAWFKALTTSLQGGRLKLRRLSYRISEALIGGENVLQTQRQIIPAQSDEWTVEISPQTGATGSASNSPREVEVVQPTNTNEPSTSPPLVNGLLLMVAALAVFCLMLLRRRPAAASARSTREAVRLASELRPARKGRSIVASADMHAPAASRLLNRVRVAHVGSKKKKRVDEEQRPEEQALTEGTAARLPVKTPEGARDQASQRPAEKPQPRPKKLPQPAPAPAVDHGGDDGEIDSYERLGRRVSAILGAAYESADEMQRAAKNDARAQLARAIKEGAAVRDRAREQAVNDRRAGQEQAQEIIQEAESSAEQVREKTRRRVAELEEHLRRHQRLRAHEQELRNVLSQVEGVIPKIRDEMDSDPVRSRPR
jgi:hypothetical protein